MLQRHHRPTLQQIVTVARQELEDDLTDFLSHSSKKITLAETAQKMLTMYSNLSSPLIGSQIIKQRVIASKHIHSLQIDMIFDKAQLFYLQSVTHDLTKLNEEEKILHITPEDIKEYIQQINWKMGYDRESMLNETQEIGDNIDLMKFFEGVRNYQNVFEHSQKTSIENLRKFAIKAQKQLTLKKGFITSRIAVIENSALHNTYSYAFNKIKRVSEMSKRIQNIHRIYKRIISSTFKNIYTKSLMKNQKTILREIFLDLSKKKSIKNIRKGFIDILRLNRNICEFSTKTNKIIYRKCLGYQNQFIKRINNKSRQKMVQWGQGLQKTSSSLKKIAIKLLIEKLTIGKKIIQKLSNIYMIKLREGFSQIREAANNKQQKLVISDRIRGKILLSLDKHKAKPANLRKTFLSWYLRGNQQKYAKKLYNIWLNGNVSKFVFFMRMKNMINEGRKLKVRHELKVFLLLFTKNMNSYYEHAQKGYLTKWHKNALRIKNLQNLSWKVQNLGEHINHHLYHDSFNKILEAMNKKKIVSKYRSRYAQALAERVQSSFNIWKAIPNIKKAKGRLILMKFMKRKLQLLDQGCLQTLKTFKANKQEGKTKKIQFLNKAFSKDILYKANIFSRWRRNIAEEKFDELVTNKQNSTLKDNAIRKLMGQISKKNHLNCLNVIEKFNRRKQFSQYRHKISSKTFLNLISKNQQEIIKQSFQVFVINNNQAHEKKNRLVEKLVAANKIKQAEVFYTFRTLATVSQHHERQQRTTRNFFILSTLIKEKISKDLFTANPEYKVLQKIGINYVEQIKLALQSLKDLPPRIKWGKRTKSINFYNKLQQLVKKGENTTFSSFKNSHFFGQVKKKKILDVMVYNYNKTTTTYFKQYQRNVRQIKVIERSTIVGAFFERLQEHAKNNMQIILQNQNIWQKKSEYLKKLNIKIKQRMKVAFQLWHSNSRSISYFQGIQSQKKKRLLSFISDALAKNQYSQSKRCIHMFHKHSNIIQLQTTFLRRLCDTQAGKVSKAIMIWKNLPVPQNKQLIVKASKFQNNLLKYADKIIRHSFNVFKDQHYIGNDRKKLVIRKLVVKSCAGIENYFSLWRSNNQLITLYQKTHKINYFAEVLLSLQQQNYAHLFSGNISERAQRALYKIQQWWVRKQKDYFNRWRKTTKQIAKDQGIKKTKILMIAKIHQQIQRRKTISAIKKIKQRAYLGQFLSKYFIQLRKNNVNFALREMKNLIDWKKTLKKRHKLLRLKAIVSNFQRQNRKDMNIAFEVFRSNRYTGNFRKNKACQIFLKDKISQVHKILSDWNYLAKQKKKQQKYEKVRIFFSSSEQISKSNFTQVFANVKDMQLKKKVIQRLLNAQNIKKKGYLNLWANRTRQIKIDEMMNNTKKKMILQRVNRLISNSSGENVKQTIKKFYLNQKITQVQTKFLKRLLQTKSGKTVEAFNKWKSIPKQNMMEKYKKGQKLFFKLENLMKRKMGETRASFKYDTEEGNRLKKQSVLQLLDITSTGTRRYYNRWARITKRDATLKQVASTMVTMDHLNEILAGTWMVIFQDQRSNKIKTWAIQRLIQASSQSEGIYFRKWRDNVREFKAQQAERDKIKASALLKINAFLKKSQQFETIHAISKFQKNLHITKISRHFLNRLLKTKSGKVMQLFEMWKSIPNVKMANKKKKAIKFQSRLNNITLRFLKKGLQPFKNQSHGAQNKKRICIQKLIRANMGEHKKKFLIWRQIVRQQKMFEHTQLFDRTFKIMSDHVSNSLHYLTKQTTGQISRKKALCRKIINNSNFVKHHAYFIWKEVLQTDNLKIQKEQNKTKLLLINLATIQKRNRDRKMQEIINKFATIRLEKVEKNLNIQKEHKNQKVLKFYERLSSFTLDKASCFLKILKQSNEQNKFLNKAGDVDHVFETMNGIVASNLYILMRSNRQTIIIEKSLKRIFSNFGVCTQKAFNIWRQYNKIEKMKDNLNNEKKKNILNILHKMINRNQTSQIPYAIAKFQKNYKQTKLQKQILEKILRSKAGKLPLAFMFWKSLPNPNAKKIKQKAMKFEAGLSQFVTRTIKLTYEVFKNIHHQGNIKKKFAVNKLVVASMSDSNRYFNKWRKTAYEQKITQKMVGLSKSFEFSNSAYKNSLLIFNKFSHQENVLKQSSAKKIYENIFANYRQIFAIWRRNIKQNKYNILVNTLTKYQASHFINRNKISALAAIHKKSDIEAVKAYINSLWKWKMSNFQANYYAKFIKIFKQSEELLSLSNCLNKKKYENIHTAFRKIILAGVDRKNRKLRITEKYLTRKIQNYFNRFKLNTSLTEIRLWKDIYQKSVKAKKVADSLQNFARKEMSIAFVTILEKCQKSKNTELVVEKLSALEFGFKNYAFIRIHRWSYQRFLLHFGQAVQSIKFRKQKECIDRIKIYGNITTLLDKIVKISEKYSLRSGLLKIGLKGSKAVEYRLAIRFMAQIYKQKMKNNKLNAIYSFKNLSQKAHALRNISNMLQNKKQDHFREFYQIVTLVKNREILLNRFRKGMVIKKILDAQDRKILKRTIEKLRKKQNRWIRDSIKQLVLKSHIKSTMAVSLWRLRAQAENTS